MRTTNIHEMYDHHTFSIMRMVLRKDSNCIDVGAHCGSVLDEIIELSPEGNHFAFEPIPSLCSALKTQSKYSAVNIYDCALSDESGESIFYLVKNDPGYSGLKQRRYDRPDPKLEEIQVRTARLDDLVASGQKIDFIKIDVEGAELPVMRGAERVICESRPCIIFESGLGASDRYGTDGRKLYEFLVDRCEMEINTLDGFLLGRNALTQDALEKVFNSIERYYFIATRQLDDLERQDHLRNYVFDVDASLFNLCSLRKRVDRLESQLRAMEATFPEIRVDSWGPKETRMGVGINVQPDGESAMWFKVARINQLGKVFVWFGPYRARGEAFMDGDLLTTNVPKAVIDNPGSYEVVIAEKSGRKSVIGTFLVNA
jgi:FkbM family methyltransferase